MPEKVIEKIKNSILPQWKICFLSALVFGFIAHLYKITNWIPNWDSLVFRYDTQNMISLGRWFLPVACAFSSFYDLPWITGLFAIILHGITAIYICKMFDVKKGLTAFLIGAIIVTFPTVTSVMMYNYVADGYSLSLLLATMAAFYLTKPKPNYILSAVFIAVSVGIYQAYITVTIMLLLCYLIRETMDKDVNIKSILLKTVKFLLTGICGMVIYYFVLTVLLKITDTKLLEYQGLNDAASLSSLNLLGSLYVIKNTFFSFFFDFSNGINLFATINSVIFASIGILYLIDIIKNKLSILKILLLAVFVCFLPIGACVLSVLNCNIDYHNLMRMGFFVFYLFLILMYEKEIFKTPSLNIAKMWTILIVSFVLIFNQTIIANISYHKLNMAYEKSYGTLIRLADRIEQTETAKDCDVILVLGALEDSQAYSSYLSVDMTGTTDGFILRADDETVGQSVMCSAINDYCGKYYKFLAGEDKKALLEKIDIDSVGNWPAKDSIFVVDDVIVIKLGEEVE